MAYVRRRLSAATLLASALLLLVVVVTVGSAVSSWASVRLQESLTMDRVLQTAAYSVSQEESLQRKYLFGGTERVAVAHADAAADLTRSMTTYEALGSASERVTAERVLAANEVYRRGTRTLFVAADDGAETGQILRITAEMVDPALEQVTALVTAAAERYEARADRAARISSVTGHTVLAVDVVTLAVVILSIALLSRWHRRFQRELRDQNERNAYQATHDALTGLPNRVVLHDRTEHALATAARTGGQVAMLLIDLDRFKEVNDTLGHHLGDLLLVQMAERLLQTTRGNDTVARLGGDEFAILLDEASTDSAAAAARRLTGALEETFRVEGVDLDIEASIGISLSQGDDETVERLLQRADVAMYQAKEHHVPHAAYDPSRDDNSPARLAMLGDLRRALASDDELRLDYQPKIAAGTGVVLGVEALLRWTHPQRGPVPPGDFIPIVEATGLMDDLTVHVLRLALAQERAWFDEGLEVPVAVNISARSLLDPRFPDRVAQLLEEYGVPARLLALELTESTIMSDPDGAVAILQRLADQGVRISIDDFGTGYSSMAYLKRLPVSELKIDRSFVMDLLDTPSNEVLVQSTVDLGHNLGLSVVAEGVEDQDVLDRLTVMGCDLAQGYHIRRPAPAAVISAWLRDSGRLPAVETEAVPAPH